MQKGRSGNVPWNTPAVRGQASGKGWWRGGERGVRIQVRFLRSHRVMGKNDAVKGCGFISSFWSAQGPHEGGQATDVHIAHHTARPSLSQPSPLYCLCTVCVSTNYNVIFQGTDHVFILTFPESNSIGPAEGTG